MNLDVLIPPLAAPSAPASPDEDALDTRLPVLEKLLAYADHDVRPVPPGWSWVAEQWGMAMPYPLAALDAEHDGLGTAGHGWVRAAPVHFVADRNRLLMQPIENHTFDADEINAIMGSLNAHFRDRGLEFFVWYCRCPPAELPRTTPLHVARRGDLMQCQPQSSGAINWRALQNEAQMLLFDHPVNAAREAAGKPAVNGVWFWGEGTAPALTAPGYDVIATGGSLSGQLARATGKPVVSPHWPELRGASGSVLAILDGEDGFWHDHAERYAERIQRLRHLDQHFFAPLQVAWVAGGIRQLRILSPGAETVHTFTLDRASRFTRFWKKSRPLAAYA